MILRHKHSIQLSFVIIICITYLIINNNNSFLNPIKSNTKDLQYTIF